MLLRPEKIHTVATSRIDSFCKIEGGEGVYIGEYVHIASFCHVNIGGGLTVMHRGSALGSGTRIISGSNVHGHGISCSAIDPSAKFRRSSVVIGENAVVFAGSTILPGVKLGKNSVVAAGAVVRESVPAYEIWGGVPARKIGEILHDEYDVLPLPYIDMKMYLENLDELQGPPLSGRKK